MAPCSVLLSHVLAFSRMQFCVRYAPSSSHVEGPPSLSAMYLDNEARLILHSSCPHPTDFARASRISPLAVVKKRELSQLQMTSFLLHNSDVVPTTTTVTGGWGKGRESP